MPNINSPVKRFEGTVTIPDYLNIGQVRAFEDSLPSLNEMNVNIASTEKVYISVGVEKKLPVILSFVTEWKIKGIPEKPTLDTFPATPIKPVAELVDWIYKEIRNLWMSEIDIPNE